MAVLMSAGGAIDEVNFSAGDLLTGKTANNSDGEAVAGTMPDNGAWNVSIEPGESVAIPKGYHTGSGNVTANTTGVKDIKTTYVTYSNHNSTWPSIINIPAGGITFSAPAGRTIIGVVSYKVHSNGVTGTWYWSDMVISCSSNSITVRLNVAASVEVYYAYY